MAGNAGQVVLLVIRDLARPHREDDLQPLGREGTEGMVMRMAAPPAPVIVDAGPLTVPQRQEGQLVDRGAQVSVAGKAELDEVRFAALLGDRHGAGVALQMLRGLPAAGRITEFGPHRGHRRPAVPARQRARPFSRRLAAGRLAKKSSTACRYVSTAPAVTTN